MHLLGFVYPQFVLLLIIASGILYFGVMKFGIWHSICIHNTIASVIHPRGMITPPKSHLLRRKNLIAGLLRTTSLPRHNFLIVLATTQVNRDPYAFLPVRICHCTDVWVSKPDTGTTIRDFRDLLTIARNQYSVTRIEEPTIFVG